MDQYMTNVINDKDDKARITHHISPQHTREVRSRDYMDIERFFYENVISFNAASSAFTNMVCSIGSYG